MSPEEVEAVKDGIQQIENGLWISNEDANKRVEELKVRTVVVNRPIEYATIARRVRKGVL